MSEVSMYSAAGTFQRLFNYLRLNQVVLDFDLKKKKKKKSFAVSVESNQGNCQNLCGAGALTADHSKANSAGTLNQCQCDL